MIFIASMKWSNSFLTNEQSSFPLEVLGWSVSTPDVRLTCQNISLKLSCILILFSLIHRHCKYFNFDVTFVHLCKILCIDTLIVLKLIFNHFICTFLECLYLFTFSKESSSSFPTSNSKPVPGDDHSGSCEYSSDS